MLKEEYTQKELEDMHKCDMFLAKVNEMSREKYEEFKKKIHKKFEEFDFDLD